MEKPLRKPEAGLLIADFKAKPGFSLLRQLALASLAAAFLVFAVAAWWQSSVNRPALADFQIMGLPLGLALLALAAVRDIGTRILLGAGGIAYLGDPGRIKLSWVGFLGLPDPTGDAEVDRWVQMFQIGRIALIAGILISLTAALSLISAGRIAAA